MKFKMRGLSEILRLFVFSIYFRVEYTLFNERRVDVMLKFKKKKEVKHANVDTEIHTGAIIQCMMSVYYSK